MYTKYINSCMKLHVKVETKLENQVSLGRAEESRVQVCMLALGHRDHVSSWKRSRKVCACVSVCV